MSTQFFSDLVGGVARGAAAQQLSGLTGPLDGISDPLDKVKDKVEEEVDKAKEVVDEALPGAGELVDDVTNEVEDSAGNLAGDSSEGAEDSGGTPGSVADEPTQAETKPSDISAPGSTDSRTTLTRPTNQSGTGSKASGAEPSGTDKVAAVGNTMESAPENDEQLAAPEADADESEGSVLSSTGAQILAWLLLACLLVAIRAALLRRRRTAWSRA